MLDGNVLTLFDKSAGPGEPLHPARQDAMALSPRIDLAAAGLESYPYKALLLDYYADLPVMNGVFIAARLRVYPHQCFFTGLPIEYDLPWDPDLISTSSPTCGDDVLLADFSEVAQGAAYCHVGLEVLELCSTTQGCTMPGGNSTPWFDNVRLAVSQLPLDVGPEDRGLPAVPELAVRPNPFHVSTTLDYAIPVAGPVTVRIYEARGALVRTLVDGASRQPGRYRVVWDGQDEHGRAVASGVFWARCEVGATEVARMLVLLR